VDSWQLSPNTKPDSSAVSSFFLFPFQYTEIEFGLNGRRFDVQWMVDKVNDKAI
jgi:hypothetical protein